MWCTLVSKMNEMDYGLKEMHEMDYSLKELNQLDYGLEGVKREMEVNSVT